MSSLTGTDTGVSSISTEHLLILTRLRSENYALKEHIKSMSEQLGNLKNKINELTAPPHILANVTEVSPDKVVIRTMPNGPLFLISRPEQLCLNVGDRVIIPNNGFNIVDVFPCATDEIANAMQVFEKPDVCYENIGGLDHVIEEIREVVELPLLRPELFIDMGIEPPKGVLLYGVPGTAKTMIAKAIANSTNSAFIKITASELARKYIGEGAKLVRDIFKLARERAPTIMFIDEIDAIASNRLDANTIGDREVQRTLMQLLSEIDGFDSLDCVRVIAATNRIDILDSAILRPGRFDRVIEVPLPDERARAEIFRIYLSKMKKLGDFDLKDLIAKTEGTSGADIKAICTEAGMFAIRENKSFVDDEDFCRAVDKVMHNEDTKKAKEINKRMYR